VTRPSSVNITRTNDGVVRSQRSAKGRTTSLTTGASNDGPGNLVEDSQAGMNRHFLLQRCYRLELSACSQGKYLFSEI